MKKLVVAAALATSLVGCSSVETATVASSEIVANGGEAVAVIQTNCFGLSFIFHLVEVVNADLDEAINKLLVGEAKAMGATRVDLKYAATTPRGGLYALAGNLVGFPSATAVGIAVK